MRKEIPWYRASSELYDGHYFSQFMIVAAHTRAESRSGTLASELLNLNSHVERLMHERNSISGKSLPRDSLLGMEIDDALSFFTTQDQSLAPQTILEFLCNSHSAMNFCRPRIGSELIFPKNLIFYTTPDIQEDSRTQTYAAKNISQIYNKSAKIVLYIKEYFCNR